MAINNISTANTFGQWLTATQALIDKQNFIEDSANVITDTANSIVIFVNDSTNTINSIVASTNDTLNDTQNVYSNTVIVYNDTVNVYSNIQSYVSTAYDTANTVELIANQANTTATLALETANAALTNVFSIQDETANSVIHYPLFTSLTSGVPNNVNVSSTNLSYIPSTGNLYSTILTSQNVVTQSINASGLIVAQDFNSTSDITLKENVMPIDNALDVIENLTGIKFSWKDTKEISYGLSAQDVEKILPEIVKTRENGLKGVNYLNIIAILIESVKELKREIQILKNDK